MANKDHSLDEAIIRAAMQEFLTNGYAKASLRKIAAAAGVTIGAIYTRYDTKDSLFAALVQPLIDRVNTAFSTLKAQYYQDSGPFHPEHLTAVIQMENQAVLHLLFDDYDRAVLLLCRSTGSRLEHFFDSLIQRKIEETEAFFHQMGVPHPEHGVLKLVLQAQFQMYVQIISEGYALEDAKRILNAFSVYHTGGWLALLHIKNIALEE